MIKKIIFDVDQTLLDSKKDCINAYLKYYGSEEKAKKLYNIIGDYDDNNINFNKEELIEYINQNIGFKFTKDDFDKIFEIYSHEATIYPNVKEVLEILSKKFELVTFSRWFASDQRERLKTAKIDIYFSNIYGFENAGIKPNKEAFINVCSNAKIEECLFVGDNYNYDYVVPQKVGMQALLLNKDNKKIDCKYITDLTEIIEYLNKKESRKI